LQNLPEIIDLIVDELGNPDARAEVAQAIERSFGFFRRHDTWFARAGKAALADNAKEIAGCIAALQSTLAAASAPLHDFLFTPLWARATLVPVDVLLAVKTTYRQAVLEPLQQMRLDCERILADEAREQEQQPLRPGPEIDRAQRHCATLAYDLMDVFARRSITGSAEGPYHTIASLLFEALTGRAEVDLKRHCYFVRTARPRLVRRTG
jgi:hypothetical protein